MVKITFLPLLASLAAAYPESTLQAENGTIQGFDTELLKVLTANMHKWVDNKNGANIVTLLARKGEIVNFDAYGVLDASNAARGPVQKDTIFRIASMTKPVVGLGMAMMYDEGKWKLDDLLGKHIPELADLKVKLANGTLVAPGKPITMAQVVSHSAGFPGALTVGSPTLSGIISPLVKDQLAFQPGRGWRYGPGVEIQGYLLEKWAGKDLSDFFIERIFKPLELQDTGFWVHPSKVARVTALHVVKDGRVSSIPYNVTTAKPRRLSPSGGLLSTAEDYFKISQLILNGGSYKGKQYVKPETIKLLHTNVLESDIGVPFGGSTGKGVGFGVDFAIVLDQAASFNNMPTGSFYWGGAFGTWFWIDPKNDVVFVGMIQNQGREATLSGETSLRQISAKALYAALKEK